MKLSLIVTTYERPDALACVLRSIARQSEPPDELLLADDGSGPPTRSLVESFRERFTYPLIHCWQTHQGFRVCRARNLALSKATGDYTVMVDGDMVLHPQFIADHRSCARPGCWVQGTRILLDERRTVEIIDNPCPPLSVYSSGGGGRRRLYSIRAPLLSSALTRAANSFVATKSCNLAAWRVDLERVNGFNEEMVGWGPEDKELAARLAHAGVARRTLIFSGIAYHLAHPPASRERHAANERILADTQAQRRVECAYGLRQHQQQ